MDTRLDRLAVRANVPEGNAGVSRGPDAAPRRFSRDPLVDCATKLGIAARALRAILQEPSQAAFIASLALVDIEGRDRD